MPGVLGVSPNFFLSPPRLGETEGVEKRSNL